MRSSTGPQYQTLLPNGEMLPVFMEGPDVFNNIHESFRRPLRLFVPLTRSALLSDALAHADGKAIREVVAVAQVEEPDVLARLRPGDCMSEALHGPLEELCERELKEHEAMLRVIEITPYHVGSMLQRKIFELNQLTEEYGDATWDEMPSPESIIAEAGAVEFAKLEPGSNVLLSVAINEAYDRTEPRSHKEQTTLEAFHALRPHGGRGNRTWLGSQVDRPRLSS